MTLRKQTNKDASDVPSVSHQYNEESQEDERESDEDDNVKVLSLNTFLSIKPYLFWLASYDYVEHILPAMLHYKHERK